MPSFTHVWMLSGTSYKSYVFRDNTKKTFFFSTNYLQDTPSEFVPSMSYKTPDENREIFSELGYTEVPNPVNEFQG